MVAGSNLPDAAPSFKRNADAEAQPPWKRDADAEAQPLCMSNFKRLCIFGEPRSETTPLVEFTIVGEPEDITVEVLDLLSQFSREIQMQFLLFLILLHTLQIDESRQVLINGRNLQTPVTGYFNRKISSSEGWVPVEFQVSIVEEGWFGYLYNLRPSH
ncbi:hypothetical protein RhiirB3_387357 [Rhizophagus irregularis]|nr:hypothetical protein RhiirB3_387357 [Rhizophagus irregularis]